MKRLTLISLMGVIATGCASGPTYLERLSQRPMPQNSTETNHECSWIRGEIYRMQTMASMQQGSMSALAQSVASRNIAALEAKAASVGCRAAFSSQSNQEVFNISPIDSCIKACTTNTERSKAQCFDACNK